MEILSQKKRLLKLIEASPLLARVSLNAGSPEVYNAFHNPLRKEGALERCLETISTGVSMLGVTWILR